MTQDKEWSCGICTFLNKPLFLSCEMCGQDRPSQRPSPPQRQRSMDPAEFDSSMESEEPRRRTRTDRAPRSVQRHRSSAQVDLGGGVMGTLIMTDDPNDYETMEGKKEDEEEEEEVPEEEDPAMDNRRRFEDPRRRRSDEAPRRVARNLPARRHTFDPDHNQAPPRQAYMDRMNSSYNRLNGSFSNFDDSFSGSYSNRRYPTMSPRVPQRTRDIQIVGQSNGLPIISVTGGHSSMQRQGSSRILMSDCSSQSQFSGDSSSRGRRPSLVHQGSSRRCFDSHMVHHHHHHPTPPPPRTMGSRGTSFASLQQQQQQPSVRNSIHNNADFLPSLEPPPVPQMDNPADVDPRSVFANDQEHSNRRNNKSVGELRRDRSQMLDSVAATSVRNLIPAPVLEEQPHPALMQDTEALDSPRTRKEKKKLQRKKLKGAVKGLMATMRLSASVVTN